MVDNRTWKAALTGAYLGYFILQPIGMIVSDLLLESYTPDGPMWVSVFRGVLMAYSFETMSWGMVFILLGTSSGMFYAKVVQETEFKIEQANEIIQESEEKFKTIFEGINDVVIYVDNTGKIVDMNKRGEDILGISRHEIIGKNFAKLGDIGFTDINKVLDLFKAPLVEGTIVTPVEMELMDKDGNKVIVEASTQLLKKGDRPEGVVSILRDITDRKLSEQKVRILQTVNNAMNIGSPLEDVLQLAAHGVRTVFDYPGCAICLLDKGSRKLKFAAFSADSVVITEVEKLTGLKIRGLEVPLFPDSRFTWIIENKKVYMTQDIMEVLMDITGDDRFKPLSDPIKKVTGFNHVWRAPLLAEREVVGIMIVASKKHMVHKDTQALEGFASQVAVVIRKGQSEEALQKAFEELKSVEKLKSDIIANVSHELRTPITVLKTTLEMMKDEPNDAVKAELLKMATDALERENWIVEDLITTAHIHAKDLELIPSAVDISSVLEDAMKVVRPKAQAKSVSFSIEKEEMPGIVADARRMTNVMIHLLDNAVKFNREGGHINIMIKNLGDNIQVSISDEGIGMEKKDMDTIFKPLTQLDHSVNRRFGGMGTGLSVVKHILEAHGGKIWAESDGLDKGCVFHFIIPQKMEEKNEEDPSSG